MNPVFHRLFPLKRKYLVLTTLLIRLFSFLAATDRLAVSGLPKKVGKKVEKKVVKKVGKKVVKKGGKKSGKKTGRKSGNNEYAGQKWEKRQNAGKTSGEI